MGTDEDPGVNIRSILELLKVCEERTNVDYSMCVSMVEVYNEAVRDLLSENSNSQQLNIHMKNKQLVITDVTEIDVKSAADIQSIMQKGKEFLALPRVPKISEFQKKEGCPILRQIYAWHCIVLTLDNNTVQKHKKRTKQSNKKFNNAINKFVGVLDKYGQC